MSLLPVPGGELYYETHGEGPAVVLAHGVGGNHAIWYRQIAVLARSYQVIVFDHRGFGLSQDSDGSGRAAFPGDLLALLDHLQIGKAALVGQSMGGGTCIAFAGLHPERVAALLIASSLHALTESDACKAQMDAARTATASLGQLERVLGQAFRTAQPAETLLYRQINSFNRTDRNSLAGSWPLLQSPAALGALGIPLMFIAGTTDVLFPVEAMRLVQAEIPGSFLVEIDAGHSVFFEQPVQFNDSMLSFLQAAGFRGRAKPAHSNTAGYVKPAA